MTGPSVNELQTRISALRELRSRGVRKVRFENDEVEYRSDAEIAAAITDLERQINTAAGAAQRIVYPKVSKGY